MSKILLKDIISYKKGNAFKSTDYQKDGVAIVRVSDFENDTINLNNLYYVSKEVADKNKNVILNKYDVVVTTVGASAGNFIRVPEMAEGYLLNQNAVRLRINSDEKFEKIYLFYALKYKKFTQYLLAGAQGSAQPSIVLDQILNAEIPYPKKDRRKYISEVLFTLDEKIELNTQINQTLEQIAQTIFKSWFIDFDPVHAKANALASGQTAEQATQAAMTVISGKNTQELHRLQTANPEQYQQLWEIAEAFPSGLDEEGVPRGWGYEKSENLFDVGIGKTPPRKEPEWFSENSNDIEWISIKDMGNSEVFVNKSSEYLLESAVNKFNVKRIPENTVILSFKLTVGRVGITTKETTTNEAIAHFRLCEKSYLTTEFLYLYLKNFDFNNLGSTSSIATAVNSKTIKEMEILYPTLEIINVFQYRVSDIFKTIRANSEQRNCLEKIRDELLPKLLSGEIHL